MGEHCNNLPICQLGCEFSGTVAISLACFWTVNSIEPNILPETIMEHDNIVPINDGDDTPRELSRKSWAGEKKPRAAAEKS
jgi:hypothetical protein